VSPRAFAEQTLRPTATSSNDAADSELTSKELTLEGAPSWARRALVLYPARGEAGHTHPGLLLFHGRGEAASETAALRAWRDNYGLERSDARLRRPPITLTAHEQRYMLRAQLDAINARLADKPYAGLCVICPVTPDPHRARQPERVLDRYSEWIEHTLLPAARAAAPIDPARGIGVDGCSMGGYVAAEVFARKPHLFRTFGVVQPAVGEFRVPRYARHLARALQRKSLLGIHLQTSSLDPYRAAVSALARHLKRQGARFTLDVLPGPHDQQWLRAAGTLAMLAWHDYTLNLAES
jgi:hypothetical protein